MLPMMQAAELGERLVRRGETLFVVEASAGGVIQAALSAVPGASRWYLGGLSCYADAIKMAWLDLPQATLVAHGAVSAETVSALARQAQDKTGASWVLAESGIYGPAGGSPEKPVGLVYLCIRSQHHAERLNRLVLSGNRTQLREAVAENAVNSLLAVLEAGPANLE